MIIFYNKKTRKIVGTVEGRVHDDDMIKNSMIKPSNVKKADIGKYVVPFRTDYKIIEEPIIEKRIVDKKTLRVEDVVVGKKKVKVSAGMSPHVPFADLILDFEKGRKSIYGYKAKLGKKGEVIGFTK